MSEKIAERRPIGSDPVPDSDIAHRWTTTVTLKSTGAQLQLVQWNTAGDFGGASLPKPTRDAPPLSQKQAVAALTGATWAPILGAVG